MTKLQKRLPLLIFLAVLLSAYTASTLTRSMQYKEFWQGYPAQYYVNDIPMVNTLDAYKWIRIAAEIKDGTYGQTGTDSLMYYPDGMPEVSPKPLLSVLLVAFSGLFDGNLHETGLWLIPILAGLFMIPFSVYFYRLGYPAAGIMGALAGTFATLYFMRTTPGRIDTDALNLFFPFLTALMILMACEQNIQGKPLVGGKYRVYIFSALAGFSQLLFYWWYHHAAFILIFAFALAASLFVCGRFSKAQATDRFSIRTIALALGVYIICANPVLFFYSIDNAFDLIRSYFTETVAFKSGFPNVYQTVSEAKGSPVRELLETLFIHPVIFMFAILGLAVLCWRKWRQMIPIMPVFAIGLLSFIGSIRFTMFLVPFLGLGIGYLINNAFLVIKKTDKRWLKDLMSYGAVTLFLLLLIFSGVHKGLTFYFMPRPSIPVDIYRTFNVLKSELPENSAIYSWWDFGLAIEAQTGLATFHDGMSQNTLKTWIIARSLIGDQQRLHRYASYLSNEGMTEISTMQREGVSPTGVLTRLDTYDKGLENSSIYLVFTGDMLSKYMPIQYIGSWDVTKGAPSPNLGGIEAIPCFPAAGQERIISGTVNCQGNEFDLALGMINRKIPIRKISYVENGLFKFEKSTRYTDAAEHVIAILHDGMVREILLMDENTYNSAFVQLFITGNYDSDLFEEVINLFPNIRVYRFIPQ